MSEEKNIPQEQTRYFLVLKQAAKYFGFKLRRLTPDGVIYEVYNNKESHRFNLSATEKNTAVLRKIAQNKLLATKVLGRLGFAVPQTIIVSNVKEAKDFLKKHKNIVVKPIDGSMGRGISIGITKAEDLKTAFSLARKNSRAGQVIIEEFIEGKDFRITIINQKYYFVAERVVAQVIGDGKSSITQLIEKENKNRDVKNCLVMDEITEKVLSESGLNYDTIIKRREVVLLRKNANISTGGIGIDRTDEISPKIIRELLKMTKTIKANTVGVDILTNDISGNNYKIIEINTRPQMMSHHFPHVGKKRYPAREIMKMLFNIK
ncbi:MAG: ATP-grasp domain-containing protein [Patescibacteria group bacterium]